MTIRELIGEGRERLQRAGISEPEASLDADLLVRHVLGWDRAALIARWHERAPDEVLGCVGELFRRREAREPVQYIIGRREFWDLDLEVSPDVLIPRPETEIIVEEALRTFASGPSPSLIVDAGTGSGCLAIVLARTFPSAHVLATDRSPAALAVARRNAARYGVCGRIEFVEDDFVPESGLADLIVSNPPYVPAVDYELLPPEVRAYEPVAALVAGPDGLAAIRALVEQSAARLRQGGMLIFEFGAGQAEAVGDLLSGHPALALRRIAADLQGIPRVAVVELRRSFSAYPPPIERGEHL